MTIKEMKNLKYVLVADNDPQRFAHTVSELMSLGWHLHGDHKMQVVADPSSVTYTRLIHVQALILPVVEAR